MDDQLTPGVDRPRGRQYGVLVLIITLIAVAAYFYRRGGPPRRVDPVPVQGAATQSVVSGRS